MSTQTTVQGFNDNQCVGATFDGIHLIDGKRTPFGKYTGSLSTVSPTDLGILSSRAVIASAGVKATDIDQTIVANIGQASADSFFLPRHIALYSGVKIESSALLVQRICGSGIEVIGQAAEQIGLKKANLVLGCGADTMSRFPLVSYNARQGFQLGKPEFVDLLWEALNDTAAVPMGMTADLLSKKQGVSRADIDAFAKRSQDRYFEAEQSGYFKGEVIRIEKRGSLEMQGFKKRDYKTKGEGLDKDENPRKTTLEALSGLSPVFSKEGPTTAGSASGIVDGACSVLIGSDAYVSKNSLKTMGKIKGYAVVGVEPEIMGIGPAPAIKGLLKATGLSLKDIDLFEINEAFGAQVLSVARALELDENKLNVHGGAIAIGHPLAATGVRLAITCLRGLQARNGKYGIISACIGGGQGIAMLLER